MATFQNTVTIARPEDEVFAFLADFGNIPAWNYAIAQHRPDLARPGRDRRHLPADPHRPPQQRGGASRSPSSHHRAD